MKLWPWPASEHVVSPSSGSALVAAALLLIPIDLALAIHGWRNPVMVGITMRHGFEEPLHGIPDWVSSLRLGLPLAVLIGLLVLGRIGRADCGLTLGEARPMLFWIVGPILLVAGIGIPFAVIRILIYRWNGWEPSERMLNPTAYGYLGFWRSFFYLCVFYPVMEEVLYRGIYVPALEHAIGRKCAVAGMGVTWVMVHWLYGWPMAAPVIVEYVLIGMLFALVFVKTRSLLAPLTLHGLLNFSNVIVLDWVKIEHADFVRGLFRAV